MSGIAVEWRDTGVADPELVWRMLRRMPHRARSGSGVRGRPHVSIGHASTSHGLDDDLGASPLVSDDGNILAFDGRLDRRDELARRLGVSERTGDGQLVLAALERWGPRGLDSIHGDFAFAFVDGASGDLLVARDRLGQRPLFFARTPRGMRIASEIQALFVDDQLEPRPNLDQLALALVREHAAWGPTLLEGVESLPAGEMLRLTKAGERRSPYWKLEDCLRKPHPRASDAVDALEDALSGAVRDRLRTRGAVAIAVSGGLDSSVVAAIAARSASTPPVLVTSRFPGLGCDETRFSDRLAAHLGLPIAVLSVPTGSAAFAPIGHRDLLSYSAHVVMRGMTRLARDAGATVLLTGTGSDELQWKTGFEVDEALGEGRFGLAAQFAGIYDEPLEFANWRRLAGATLRRTLGRNVHERLRGMTWAESARQPTHSSTGARLRLTRLRAERRERERARCVAGRASEMIVSGLVEDEQTFAVGQRALLGAFWGYEQREPFLDQRVVELLLGLHVLTRTAPDRKKPLLRDLGSRCLPQVLAHRATPQAEFSGFLRQTTLADEPALRKLLASNRMERLGLLLPGAATLLLDRAVAGAPDVWELRNLAGLERWAAAWGFGDE